MKLNDDRWVPLDRTFYGFACMLTIGILFEIVLDVLSQLAAVTGMTIVRVEQRNPLSHVTIDGVGKYPGFPLNYHKSPSIVPWIDLHRSWKLIGQTIYTLQDRRLRCLCKNKFYLNDFKVDLFLCDEKIIKIILSLSEWCEPWLFFKWILTYSFQNNY